MSKEFETLLKEATQDILTPETFQAITESFNAAIEKRVTETVEEQVSLQVEAALAKMDADHADALASVLSSIDEDHTHKLEDLVKKLDESYAEKLQDILSAQEAEINVIAEQFKSQMLDKVSDFLELALEEAIPAKMVAEAVQNTRSRGIVSEIKKLVALDETFINSNIQAALQDGRKQIDESKAALATALQKISLLTEQNQGLKTQQLLTEKTANLPTAKKEYVIRATKGKDAQFINENFSAIVKMYEKEEQNRTSLLKEEAEKEIIKKIPDIVPIKKDEKQKTGTEMYLEGFAR